MIKDSEKSERGLLIVMILAVGSAGFALGAFCMGWAMTHQQKRVDVNAPVKIVPPSELETLPNGTKQQKPTSKPTPRSI